MKPARPFLLLTGVALLGAVAAGAQPSAPAGNPLWKVSLTQLSSTRERPIFSLTRRPPQPPPPPTQVARTTVQPPVKPPEAQRPAVSLLGTVIGTEANIGIFLETATQTILRLRVGEDHQGWVLRQIRAGAVTLAKEGEPPVVLLLPPTDEGSARSPKVATAPIPNVSGENGGTVPIVSNENYVDEQPRPVRASRKR